MQGIGIRDADPDPRACMTLIALDQEQMATSSRHGRPDARIVPVDDEAEDVDVVVNAPRQILDWQDRITAPEIGRYHVAIVFARLRLIAATIGAAAI